MNVIRGELDRAAKILAQSSLKERSATLRKFRRQYTFTLAEIALLAQLNKSTLSRYERGLTDLKVATFSRLETTMREIVRARGVAESYVRRVAEARAKHSDWDSSFSRMGEALVPPRDAKALKQWIVDRTKEHVQYGRVRDYASALEQEYKGRIAEHENQIADANERIAELRDLLKLETEAALVNSERDELREKIERKVPSDESED